MISIYFNHGKKAVFHQVFPCGFLEKGEFCLLRRSFYVSQVSSICQAQRQSSQSIEELQTQVGDIAGGFKAEQTNPLENH